MPVSVFLAGEVLQKGERENEAKVFEELEYSISFFSSANEDNLIGFQMRQLYMSNLKDDSMVEILTADSAQIDTGHIELERGNSR